MRGERLRGLWHDLIATREAPAYAREDGASGRPIARWIEAAGILAAGNLATGLSWIFRYPINSGPFAIALAIGLYVYVYLRLAPAERVALLAAAWPPRARPVVVAVVAGLALAIPSLLFLVVSVVHGMPPLSAIKSLSVGGLVVRLLIEIPLLTALVEELVFRQYLYRQFLAATPAKTVVLNAAIFTLWHLVVTLRTVIEAHYTQQTLLLAGAYLGALLSIFVGGVIFAIVRIKTGSFGYATISHWLADGLITLGTWLL